MISCSCLCNTLKCKTFNGITKEMYNNETIKQRMRIGILTLPLHTNYGGILQVYALQTVLERMGHEVEIINIPFKRPSIPITAKIKRLVKRLAGCYKGYINYEEKFNSWLPIMSQNVQSFKDRNLHLSQSYKDYAAILKFDYECIIVGSDQIWRPRMFLSDISHAYLSFTQNWHIRRIAYSASFGTDTWEYTPEQTAICKRLLKMFDAVSLRESGGVVNCKRYFDVNAIHTLDPTMLLTASDYESLIADVQARQDKQLFSYILDNSNEKENLVNEFAGKRNLKVLSINPQTGNVKCRLEQRIVPSVEDWLRGFRDSDFVVTDSFHACVFSILFRKPFAVIVNDSRGSSRFISLLSMFGLENRIVTKSNSIYNLPPIDYDMVHKKWESYYLLSYKYLENSLLS